MSSHTIVSILVNVSDFGHCQAEPPAELVVCAQRCMQHKIRRRSQIPIHVHRAIFVCAIFAVQRSTNSDVRISITIEILCQQAVAKIFTNLSARKCVILLDGRLSGRILMHNIEYVYLLDDNRLIY